MKLCEKVDALAGEGIASGDHFLFDALNSPTLDIVGVGGEDMGFYTIRSVHDNPLLQHFYIKPGYRTPTCARYAIRKVLAHLKELGFVKLILVADKEYLQKIIEYYFKTKSYAIWDSGTSSGCESKNGIKNKFKYYYIKL